VGLITRRSRVRIPPPLSRPTGWRDPTRGPRRRPDRDLEGRSQGRPSSLRAKAGGGGLISAVRDEAVLSMCLGYASESQARLEAPPPRRSTSWRNPEATIWAHPSLGEVPAFSPAPPRPARPAPSLPAWDVPAAGPLRARRR